MSDSFVPADATPPRQNGIPYGYPSRGAGSSSDGTAFSLVSIFKILRRQWLIIIGMFLGVAATMMVYTVLQDPIYDAYSVVLVNTDEGPAQRAEDLFAIDPQNRSLANEIEILKQSLTLLRRVASRLVVARRATTSAHPDSLGEDPMVVQQVVQSLAKRVQFAELSKNVDMIRITASSTDPEEAAMIANFYAEAYLQRSQDASRASVSSSRVFLDDQVQKRERELEDLEQQLAAFMLTEGVIALDQESENAVSQIAELDAMIEEARVELVMETSALQSLQQEVDRIEPGLAQRVASGVENEIQSRQTRIAELEAAASEYYAVDPSLRGNESRDAELAAIVARIQSFRDEVETLAEKYVREVEAVGGVDPTVGGTGLTYLSELKRQVVEKSINVQGLQAKLAVLQEQLQRYDTRLREIPRQSIQLAQLQRSRLAVERLYLLLVEKQNEARIAEESELGYVEIIRPATVPATPVRPDKMESLLLGILLGLMFGVGLAFVRDSMDHRVHSPDDLRHRGFRLLGVVPDMRRAIKSDFGGRETFVVGEEKISTAIQILNPMSPIAEAYRHVRTNIQHALRDSAAYTVAITSAVAGEGKTVTSINLAVAMAQTDRKTLYIDADLRKPSGHTMLGRTREPGLTDLLFAFSDRTQMNWNFFKTGIENLYLLPAGELMPNPSELLGSKKMRELLEVAQQSFDVIVIDTPPVLYVTDAVVLSTVCDATILVVGAEKVRVSEIALAQNALQEVDVTPLGLVLNRLKEPGGDGYQYAGYYKYGISMNGQPVRGTGKSKPGKAARART